MMDYMPTPDEVAAGRAAEAAKREAAEKPLAQYGRGILTVGELAEKLREINEAG